MAQIENQQSALARTGERKGVTIKARDGSGRALEFLRDRCREVHIDHEGNITPVSDWQRCGRAALTDWIVNTSANESGLFGRRESAR